MQRQNQGGFGLVVLFFSLLFLGLFLGDGKQAVIAIFGVSIVVVMWLTQLFQQKRHRQPPRWLLLPWMAYFGVTLVSSMMSDSVGYSISWMVIFLCGYLVYRLFYAIATEYILRQFVTMTCIFVGLAAVVFVAIPLTPWLRDMIPSMNLVALNYGHSHFADLLVFVTPIVFYAIVKIKNNVFFRWGTLIPFLLLLFFTRARGAWILVILYVVWEVVHTRLKGTARSRSIALGASSLLAILLIGLWFVKLNLLPTAINSIILRPLDIKSRIEYWRQAAVAIQEKPLFGHGPGTFSLVSTRLQRGWGKSSWFAHSQVLEIGAESGLVGLAIYIWLLSTQARAMYLSGVVGGKNKHIERALLLGVTLIFLYGTIEFVFDFLITSYLFWAGLGLLSGVNAKANPETQDNDISVIVPLVIVGTFYMLWIISSFYITIGRQNNLAFDYAPFDATYTLAMIENSSTRPISKRRVLEALYFHKDNPQILFALAKATQKTTPQQSRVMFERAVSDDPQNIKLVIDYISPLLMSGDTEVTARTLAGITDKSTILLDPSVKPFLTKNVFQYINGSEKPGEYFAKIYYLLGLAVVQTNPEKTRELWLLAWKMAPQWSYFRIELASLYFYDLSNKEVSKSILTECLSAESLRSDCSAALRQGLKPAGSLAEKIRGIPFAL